MLLLSCESERVGTETGKTITMSKKGKYIGWIYDKGGNVVKILKPKIENIIG